MTINIFAEPAEPDEFKAGYQVHAINLAKALSKYEKVCFMPLMRSKIEKDRELANLISNSANINVKDDVSIMVNYDLWLAKFAGKIRIGALFYECTVLPEKWLNLMRQLDYVWIASRWGKEILIKNGLADEKISVVPSGVDEKKFNPQNNPLKEFEGNKAFKYLCVGKIEERKGQRQLLEAFIEEFGKDEGVNLIFLCFNPFLGNYQEEMKELRNNLKETGFNNIMFLDTMSEADLCRLYASCDAFVLPTKGEGWCLPIIEAAASGLPIITTYYSGHTEYLSEEDIYEIEIEKFDEIYDPVFLPRKGAYGVWAVPSKESLKIQMRYVYEHREEAKTKGFNLSEKIRKNWNWDMAAQKAIKELSKIR